MLKGFKDMSMWLWNHAQIRIHPDTLRKAVRDEANPLPVEWDNGFAEIKPDVLMSWREKRRGVRRACQRAA